MNVIVDTSILICAISERYRFPLLTTDKDFYNFSTHLPIQLHSPRQFEDSEHSAKDATGEDS